MANLRLPNKRLMVRIPNYGDIPLPLIEAIEKFFIKNQIIKVENLEEAIKIAKINKEGNEEYNEEL